MTAAPNRLTFCMALAAIAVLLRVALADEIYFRLIEIPEHDMSQGLAFFATSMHSMRIAGDLAWWNPTSMTGYAQYYEALFLPIAPTYGHIVFIAWAELIGMLGALGIAVPEYYQYLAVNYLVLPFLAFTAFCWFCSLFLRRREAIALALVVYVLSGIGLWNSAWFYFQEPFTLFLLLGTSIAVLQRPTPGRALAWLAAALVQVASVNYWTVYNIFFVAIVLGAYAGTHRNQCVRLVVRIRRMLAANPRGAALAGGAFVLAAAAWGAVIIAALVDQGSTQARAVFDPNEVARLVQEVRRSTTELFNPSLERTLRSYPAINQMHNARYIGLAMLPLIAIGAVVPASRRSRWLLACLLLVGAVAVATPLSVYAWEAIPSMNRIRHVFRFYSHYWQIVLVLIGAVGLDAVLASASWRRRRLVLWIVGIGAFLSIATMVVAAWFSHRFPNEDPTLEALLRSALVLGLASAILFRATWSRQAREIRFAAWGVIFIAFTDLSGYFHTVTRADMAFTAARWPYARPEAEAQFHLAHPWGAPDPKLRFTGGLERWMPIVNDFWPVNLFIVAPEIYLGIDDSLHRFIASQPPLAFYAQARVVPDQRVMPAALVRDPRPLDRQLLVARSDGSPPPAAPSESHGEPLTYRWTRWLYNGFTFEVTVPADGWLLVRQHYDPGWQILVDGARVVPTQANYISMAFPVSRGSHRIALDYWSLSRRLYWPAAFLLQAALAVFLACALRGASRASRIETRARPAV